MAKIAFMVAASQSKSISTLRRSIGEKFEVELKRKFGFASRVDRPVSSGHSGPGL